MANIKLKDGSILELHDGDIVKVDGFRAYSCENGKLPAMITDNMEKRPTIIIMMAFQNPRLEVSLAFRALKPDLLIPFANGLVKAQTGDPDLDKPEAKLGDITTQSGDLSATRALIMAGDRSKKTKDLEIKQRNLLADTCTANAHWVEDTADDLSGGDMIVAKEIIDRSGHKINKKSSGYKRTFEQVTSDIGMSHFRTDTEIKGSAILWRCGITSKKGTPPTDTRIYFTKKLDIILTDVPSGSVLAVQKADSETISKIKKYKHPTFSWDVEDPYTWSDWIYVVIP